MNCEGFIEAIDYGEMPGKPGIDFLITQLLGPSLQTVLTLCESKFSLHCACLVTMQMLNVMESMHNKGYIHRDLKPDNYMFGLRHETQKLFLIDYGLVKRILNPKNGRHIPFETNKQMCGTLRYCSSNIHRGHELSRRDDIESILYLLIYSLKGKLPW